MKPPLQQSYDDYVAGVIAGEIPACALIRLACQRHVADLAHGEARGLVFDRAAAARAIKFIECLRHSEAEWRGRPLILAGWQRFIVASLFGWKRRATGFRRYKRAYIEIPRKNAKSTLGAAIALYMFVGDGEGAPQVYTAATNLDQAALPFEMAKRMVALAPALNRRIARFRTEMTIDNQDAVLAPLHSESSNLDGLNVHFALVDEYHEHRTSGTYDKLRTSTRARRQHLILIITTAGDDLESPCFRERTEATNVLQRLNGTEDDTFFAFIACPDDGDDWRDEATWWKANPNLEVSCLLDNMREEFVAACNSPVKEADFKRYNLDIWNNEEKHWIRFDDWRACHPHPTDASRMADPIPMSDREAALAGRECTMGIDFAAKEDTTAVAFFFPATAQHPRPELYVRYYLPRLNAADREARDKIPYTRWIREGWIVATEGDWVDQEAIYEDILRLNAIFVIRGTGVDIANMAWLAPKLIAAGLTLTQVRQGMLSLNDPTKELQGFIVLHTLIHGGHPLLTAQVLHCCVVTDRNENIMPTKATRTKRIDGVAAAVNAVRIAIDAEETVTAGIQFL